MKHLFSYSVYQPLSDMSQAGAGPAFGEMGCDGLELLTGYSPVPEEYRGYAAGVHLPYAADWMRAWEGADIPDCDPETARFMMFGKCAEDVTDSLTLAIAQASVLDPPYGVLHAGNINLDELFMHDSGDSDAKVLGAFCEMVNAAVSMLPRGRPPFKIAFENLWWPGLKMKDGRDVKFFERKIEFEEWGICLDTGHLLNCLPDIRNEQDAISSLRKVFEGYGEDTLERIGNVHLHVSTSSDYRDSFEDRERDRRDSVGVMMEKANAHICKIDQHRPFMSDGCAELVGMLSPEYVTHEMAGSVSGDPLGDFRAQRSHFPRA
ncbi:MAG: hypothetical protein AB7S83_02445 [Candidatus Methanomethylophilaceae archaeon]